MDESTPHIPERGPEAQLTTAIDFAEASDGPLVDAAADAVETVIGRIETTPLQRAYCALSLLESYDAPRTITDHWTEDALAVTKTPFSPATYSADPHTLIDTLYQKTLRELTQQAISGNPSGESIGYTEFQPPTLDLHPSPEETFQKLRCQLGESPTRDEVADLLTEEFQDTYKAWKDTVVVQHILYLVEEDGVNPEDTGYVDQFGHGEPRGADSISYVFDSVIYYLTEAHLLQTPEAEV